MKIQPKLALMFTVSVLMTSGTVAQAVVEQGRPLPDTSIESPTATTPPEEAEMRITTTQAPVGDDDQAVRQEKLQARIAERKLKRSLALSEADKQQIATRCSAAQGKIRSLEGKIQGIETSRRQVYANLLSKLNNVTEKLSAAGADTAELESQTAEVNVQIEAFYVMLTDYKQAVADLGAMDCQADPEAFKATLESAREARALVKTSAQEIRQLFTGTITETLRNIRDQVSTTSTEGTEE